MKRLGAPALAALLAHAAAVHADAPTCIEDHEAGGRARREGRLVESLSRFRSCVSEACPSVIRDECSARAAEVLAAAPSLVFAASDGAGNDRVAIAVRLDGKVVAERLDGRPYLVDPGEHTISFEAPGRDPVIKRVLVREGEKNRRIEVVFPAPPARAAEPPGPQASAPPVAAYVLGGVGVVALATFVGFAVAGRSQQSELERCAPKCAPERVDVMQRRYLIADIALALSAVGLGASAYLFITAGPSSSGSARGTRSALELGGRF